MSELERVVVTRSNYPNDGTEGWVSAHDKQKELEADYPNVQWRFVGCTMDTYGFEAYVSKEVAKSIK